MIRSMSCLLVASLLAVTVSSATTSTQTGADLVSVILASIKGRNEMDSVARYLEMSRDALAKELPLESSGRKLSYTFFAPTSFAFTMQMPLDAVDPLVVDESLRNKVLTRHFARQRVSSDDLSKLDKLVMADAKEAALTRTADTKTNRINNAEIQPGAIQLSNNLGTVYFVDRVFMTGEEVGEAIRAHSVKNPNSGFGLFGVPPPPDAPVFLPRQ
ncbi:uncharacterized protein LOC124343336 [Daphnia pulicaria]|uniref:uncharacterized protein LOC124343336 n=1 Tax=Daphnia pulicaria TaxID=35523 RepID=UPI001EEC6D81|nr:uncharacterized protein LOC124343336 [Daphnia pulicaria]